METKEEFVKLLGKGAYGFVNLVRYNNPDDNSSTFFSNSRDVPGSSHVSETLSNKVSADSGRNSTNYNSSLLPKVVSTLS
ncbi:BnaA08g03960D [Brassica napus]|uniref:BnaA08g03960D protein n=1 Tax=Brassica napus TaxID=3708 RepID=A0A078FWF1_BRANA|nr:BnaA08g03960D [Brassica napus]